MIIELIGGKINYGYSFKKNINKHKINHRLIILNICKYIYLLYKYVMLHNTKCADH